MKKYILTENELRDLLLESIVLEIVEDQSNVDFDEIVEQSGIDINGEIDECILDFLEYKK